MAPVIMGNPDRPQLGAELTNSFCRTDPDDRPALRPGDLHLGQPGRPRRRPGAHAGPAVLGGRHRAGRRRRLRAPARSPAAPWSAWTPPGTAPTSAPRRRRWQRSRPSWPLADAPRPDVTDDDAALLEDSAEDLYEHAPCGYLSSYPDGRIAKVNQTFLTWTGYAARGARRAAPVHRPAHRGRPDLPRDPLRAAAADAGLGAGDRDGPGAGRRQPDAGARQLAAAHR